MIARNWLNIAGLSFALGVSASRLHAATINAASCSQTDVQSAIFSAADGDTVLVPAGTCTWTQTVVVAAPNPGGGANWPWDPSFGRNITLQGAGVGQTVILHAVNPNNSTSPTTFFLSNALAVLSKSGGLSRVTGMEFRGTGLSDPYNKGVVQLRGSSNQLRFDHNKIVPNGTSGMAAYGDLRGVIDHNTFDISSLAGFALYTFHDSWNGVGAYGDNSWASPDTLGTLDAIFIEDNTFLNNESVGFHNYSIDGWMGGRVVIRNNSFINVSMGNHGTESGGRQRGQRQYEVYNNNFTFNLLGNAFASLIGMRGGVGVVFGNTATITNGSINEFFDMQYYRATASFSPWGQCPSAWDLSATVCLDQTGVGQGSLISGDTPAPVGWPNEVSDPTYAWNNVINGTVSNPVGLASNIIAGRDYFTTPRPGYRPFQYPHPLAGGSTSTVTPVPAKPSGLALR